MAWCQMLGFRLSEDGFLYIVFSCGLATPVGCDRAKHASLFKGLLGVSLTRSQTCALHLYARSVFGCPVDKETPLLAKIFWFHSVLIYA